MPYDPRNRLVTETWNIGSISKLQASLRLGDILTKSAKLEVSQLIDELMDAYYTERATSALLFSVLDEIPIDYEKIDEPTANKSDMAREIYQRNIKERYSDGNL